MQFDLDLLKRGWFLAGPTASGKSAAGLELARRLDAEIISLDSMAIYRGMDIGTAKPTMAQRCEVPHHLIDVVDPHEEYSLADYVNAAATAAKDIAGRGKTVLFVGGTGLYLRGVLRGVFDGPSADWEFRKELEAAARESEDYLHQRLRAVDPIAAERLHPRDHRRLIRAIEVHHITGEPLSAQHRHGPLPEPHRPRNVFWIHPPRDWLHERINRRVEEMLEQGLVAEVERLLLGPLPLSRTARQALGYKEVIDHLEGQTGYEEMADLIQRRTRQFAKRQHTWFRNLEECHPIKTQGTETPMELADEILREARRIEETLP
jgi:tRNA dimethylallyltransferase